MRKVIDSNKLQSEELYSYLSQAKDNFAVLSDYAAMEAYKGDTLTSIYKSMEVVSEFPEQIVVLKNTRVVCGLSGRGAGLQKRLIDRRQTKEFSEYVGLLRLAKAGNLTLQNQLLEHGEEANAHLARMLKDAESTRVAVDELARTYSKAERRVLQGGQPYTVELIDKIVRDVLYLAAILFEDHPAVNAWPSYSDLPNTFIFRSAICTYFLALDWGVKGGVRDARTTSLRNDMIDMNFATYATFFDGLLSGDIKTNRIHEKARLFLSALFDCCVRRAKRASNETRRPHRAPRGW